MYFLYLLWWNFLSVIHTHSCWLCIVISFSFFRYISVLCYVLQYSSVLVGLIRYSPQFHFPFPPRHVFFRSIDLSPCCLPESPTLSIRIHTQASVHVCVIYGSVYARCMPRKMKERNQEWLGEMQERKKKLSLYTVWARESSRKYYPNFTLLLLVWAFLKWNAWERVYWGHVQFSVERVCSFLSPATPHYFYVFPYRSFTERETS